MEPVVSGSDVFVAMVADAQSALHLCRCCLRRAPDKRLTTPYTHLGNMEIYLDMLKECFDIRLAETSELSPEICEVCVGRLRDASDFKRQVERSQAALEVLLDRALQTIKSSDADVQIKTDIADEDDTASTANEIPHDNIQIKTDIADEDDVPSTPKDILHVQLKEEIVHEEERPPDETKHENSLVNTHTADQDTSSAADDMLHSVVKSEEGENDPLVLPGRCRQPPAALAWDPSEACEVDNSMLQTMAKSTHKQTKEEKLEKKKIAEKLRYERIKNDPQKLAAEKEKRKEKYKKMRETGKKKLVSEMTAREKRKARKKWRQYSDKSYNKKKSVTE